MVKLINFRLISRDKFKKVFSLKTQKVPKVPRVPKVPKVWSVECLKF